MHTKLNQQLRCFLLLPLVCLAIVLPTELWSNKHFGNLDVITTLAQTGLQNLRTLFSGRNITDEILVFVENILRFHSPASLRSGSQSFTPDLSSLAITDIRPLFIFNTTMNVNLTGLTPRSAAELISSSAPFSLPRAELSDYFIALPPSKIRQEQVKASGIHFHRHFQYGDSEDGGNSTDHNNRASVVGFIFADQDGSNNSADYKSVYDTLAKYWVGEIGAPNFLRSTFCSVGPTSSSQGYCVSIKNDSQVTLSLATGQSISIFKRDIGTVDEAELDVEDAALEPTEAKEIQSHEDEDEANYRPIVFESQVIRQIHDKFRNLGQQVATNAEHANESPKDFLKAVDMKVDAKIDALGDSINRAGQRIAQVPGQMADYVNDYIDETIERVADSRWPKEDDDEYDTYSYAFQRLDTIDSGDESDGDPNYRKRELALDFDEGKARKFDRTIVVPLSLVQAAKPSPRSKSYTQVLESMGSRLSPRKEAACVPVTWYNVFHHGIFGTTNFCG